MLTPRQKTGIVVLVFTIVDIASDIFGRSLSELQWLQLALAAFVLLVAWISNDIHALLDRLRQDTNQFKEETAHEIRKHEKLLSMILRKS